MSSSEAAARSDPSSALADLGQTESAAESTLPGARSWADLEAAVLFEKVLTSSDINPQGRIVVPKAQAEKHLPFLEKQSPSQVYAQDTFGNQIVFKYRFWTNNQSRMYLLEGTQKIRSAYHLGPGDVIQFGKNTAGDLIVAGRKGTKADIHRKPPPPRGSSPAVAGAERAMTAAKRKRMQSSGHGKVMLTTELNNFYFEPLKDGVFRAVPDGCSDDAARIVKHMGVWTVILNLCGELYQAYFDSQAAALEALNAAGEPLPPRAPSKLVAVAAADSNIFRNHASSDNSIRHQISSHARCVAMELGGIKREKPYAHAPKSGVTATPSAPVASVLRKWILLPCNKCLSGE